MPTRVREWTSANKYCRNIKSLTLIEEISPEDSEYMAAGMSLATLDDFISKLSSVTPACDWWHRLLVAASDV